MKPMQKYRLVALAILSSYFLLLIFELTTRPGKWIAPVCLFSGIGALAFMFRHFVTHPELRPTQEERAKRMAAINPGRARLITISLLLLTLLACSMYLVFAHEPRPGVAQTNGLVGAHALGSFTRGAAWSCIGVTIAMFARVCQVAHRRKKAGH
jgi:hypothetical protein